MSATTDHTSIIPVSVESIQSIGDEMRHAARYIQDSEVRCAIERGIDLLTQVSQISLEQWQVALIASQKEIQEAFEWGQAVGNAQTILDATPEHMVSNANSQLSDLVHLFTARMVAEGKLTEGDRKTAYALLDAAVKGNKRVLDMIQRGAK